MGHRLPRRRRSGPPLGEDRRAAAFPHHRPGRKRQFLGHGRHRPLRPLLRDPHRPGRGHVLRPGLRHRQVRVRPVSGDLEQRLHAVQPHRGRRPEPPAQTQHRHRHGPGAPLRRHPGGQEQFRLRPAAAGDRRDRIPGRPGLRRQRDAERALPGHRRPFPGHRLSDRRRGAAVQRRPGLRAPAHHAPGHPLRAAPEPAHPVPVPGLRRGGGAHGRDLPRTGYHRATS